jgi:beta-lactamase class A
MSEQSVLRELREELAAGGLEGSFLARDLDTGRQTGIDVDRVRPIASIVKIPLAIATLERIRIGELDGTTLIRVEPATPPAPSFAGLGRLRHPVAVAVEDLLYFSCSLSDNIAADLLFDLTPPPEVAAWMRRLDLGGIAVRHRMHDLIETPIERFGQTEVHLAHALAIGAATPGSGHAVRQLDVSQANAASASALVALLEALWKPSHVAPEVATHVRGLMRGNVVRHRLAPDFSSDQSVWSSKTGTLMNLRHEAGVVEYRDGGRFAVVALTESHVPAAVQPQADALMAHVARTLVDLLR